MDNKDDFSQWLNNNDISIYAPVILSCFEEINKYSLSHNILKISIWEINDYHIFNDFRNKISSNRLIKFSHPKQFSIFEKFGKFYSEY